jgi:hypothetical protein
MVCLQHRSGPAATTSLHSDRMTTPEAPNNACVPGSTTSLGMHVVWAVRCCLAHVPDSVRTGLYNMYCHSTVAVDHVQGTCWCAMCLSARQPLLTAGHHPHRRRAPAGCQYWPGWWQHHGSRAQHSGQPMRLPPAVDPRQLAWRCSAPWPPCSHHCCSR